MSYYFSADVFKSYKKTMIKLSEKYLTDDTKYWQIAEELLEDIKFNESLMTRMSLPNRNNLSIVPTFLKHGLFKNINKYYNFDKTRLEELLVIHKLVELIIKTKDFKNLVVIDPIIQDYCYIEHEYDYLKLFVISAHGFSEYSLEFKLYINE